jgi:hypothetical protein
MTPRPPADEDRALLEVGDLQETGDGLEHGDGDR